MKRSREEVIASILELCKEPASITRIVYQGYLNFKNARDYINELTASKLIMEIPGKRVLYQTTPRGLEVLGHIKTSLDLLNPDD
jgi:predicted transcriptional regulator